MPHAEFCAAVQMQWTRLDDRWQSEKWEVLEVTDDPLAATEGAPAVPVRVQDDPRRACWLHRGHVLTLYRDEAEGYYLNLSAAQPFVFVTWRLEDALARPYSLTLSYNEAARTMDAGEHVDGVPMPGQWLETLAAFVALHYRPEGKKHRARPPSFKGARRDES